MQRSARMKRELQLFQNSPPHGITCFTKGDRTDQLEALQVVCLTSEEIIGPEGTPYEKGIFKLDVQLPERYPFEPPKVSFVTPIYHPNIDNAGRICLDSLKMPPKGAWKPALNVCTVLTSIQLLMSEPNPEDPLMTDISHEFKYQRSEYNKHAQEWTLKYATQKTIEKKESTNQKKEDTEESSSDSESSQSESEETLTNQKTSYKKRPSNESASVLQENVKRIKE